MRDEIPVTEQEEAAWREMERRQQQAARPAAPPSAGQVLTDEEIAACYSAARPAGARRSGTTYAICRAVEAAVLAKVHPPSGQSATGGHDLTFAFALADAMVILNEVAQDLRVNHTKDPEHTDWAGEPEAKAHYGRLLNCLDGLRAQPAAATVSADAILRDAIAHGVGAYVEIDGRQIHIPVEVLRGEQPSATVPEIVREALEAAKSGLAWYREWCPEVVDGSDDEADELIERALSALAAPVAAQAPMSDEAIVAEALLFADSSYYGTDLVKRLHFTREGITAFVRSLGGPRAPAANGDAPFLQETDQHALHRFIETTEDDESYDIGKDTVKRLAQLGVVSNHGFGRYSVTAFGYWAHERFWHQNPPLPLRTNSDRDNDARAAMQRTTGSDHA